MNEEAPLSDGGSDADRRRWTHKRAQFDSAIQSARLLSFIQRLASGEVRHQEIIAILLKVNASKDQAQYVAETLAMKKELRGLARQELHPEIALFFTEAAHLIPQLTDGLASQVMMLLGHAAQNDAYLDTVSNAVSALLADLDHPLNREARNYLRLLWDQMEATRRLKQTEAQFGGVSVPPPSASERALRDSGKLPRAVALRDPISAPVLVAEAAVIEPSNHTAKMDVASVEPAHSVVPAESSNSSTAPEASPSQLAQPNSETPAPSPSGSPEVRSSTKTVIGGIEAPALLWSEPAPSSAAPAEPTQSATLAGPAFASEPLLAMPSKRQTHPDLLAVGSSEAQDTSFDAQTNEFFSRSEAPQPESARESTREPRPAVARLAEPDIKLPTNSVPRWAVITASVAVAGVVAAVVYVTREPSPESTLGVPSAKASAHALSPSAQASAQRPNKKPQSQPSAAYAAPPPPPPPPVVTPPPQAVKPAEPKPTPDPAPAKPVSARVAVDSPNVSAPQPAKSQPGRPQSGKQPSATPAPSAHATPEESQPRGASASIVTPPEVAKNLSPLDRIVAELRLISPDAVGIEDKARELSRIIATSKRKDAIYIIDHLGPQVAIDTLGRDPTLEESLRTFAISTLGRVALDDDDGRAVSAIFMLGEWAKSAGKGRQKAIAALDSLGKESIVKTSAPRTKALRAAKAQIDE
jgi:hypothetical protein